MNGRFKVVRAAALPLVVGRMESASGWRRRSAICYMAGGALQHESSVFGVVDYDEEFGSNW